MGKSSEEVREGWLEAASLPAYQGPSSTDQHIDLTIIA